MKIFIGTQNLCQVSTDAKKLSLTFENLSWAIDFTCYKVCV